VLVYPVRHDPAWSEPAERWADPDRALADLLGRTRAAVLRSISAGACSTSELAARAGISLASASEHAHVLHRTGLVTTRRVGSAVRHTISPIGTDVLTAPTPDRARSRKRVGCPEFLLKRRAPLRHGGMDRNSPGRSGR
jgi:DNA-binding transcriptional ArsR family regulator